MKRLVLADVQPIIATNYASVKVGSHLFCYCRTSRQLEKAITKGSQSAIRRVASIRFLVRVKTKNNWGYSVQVGMKFGSENG